MRQTPPPIVGVRPGRAESGRPQGRLRVHSPTAMCLAAVDYANEGWFVSPLHGINDARACTCRRGRYCAHAGKHPFGRLAPHGARDASRRPEVVGRWFSTFRWMNVGIVPGPSGLVVLDEDPRNFEIDSAPDVLGVIVDLPVTLTARTGGGGRHFYFADPERRARTRLLLPGLEIKAGRSLLVAPPSGHKSGGSYHWLDVDVPVAPAPEWLISGDVP